MRIHILIWIHRYVTGVVLGVVCTCFACESHDHSASSLTQENTRSRQEDNRGGMTMDTLEEQEMKEPEFGGMYFEGDRYLKSDTYSNVVKALEFSSLLSPGVAVGFDLDGQTSEEGDTATCGHADLTAPDGREGIDNQLAKIWGVLEPLVGPQVQALLQNAINEGRVLIMIELEDVQDLHQDESVTLNVFRGVSRPEIGTNGLITPDQSFNYDYDSPISTVEGVSIQDGVLEAGPVEIKVPLSILDLQIIANIARGRIRLNIAEDGSYHGFISGALNVPDTLAALLDTGAASEARLVQPIFEQNADLEPIDGVCTYMSLSLGFEGTRAFVIRDHAQEHSTTMIAGQEAP